mgnify:CR=1 FL=1
MMKAKSIDWTVKASGSTMPLCTVLVTSPPAITAPLTSKIGAAMSACFMLSVPAPTDVPTAVGTEELALRLKDVVRHEAGSFECESWSPLHGGSARRP